MSDLPNLREIAMRIARIVLPLTVGFVVLAGMMLCFIPHPGGNTEIAEDTALSSPPEPSTQNSLTSSIPASDAYVEGLVRDPSGKPIANAYVLAIPIESSRIDVPASPEAMLQWTGGGASLSDSEGYFALSGLAFDSPYYVTVQHEEHASAKSDEFQVVRGQPAPYLELTLETGCTVSGVAALEDESPARSQFVHLVRSAPISADEVMKPILVERTDDQGRFAFKHVSTGAYWLCDESYFEDPGSEGKNLIKIMVDGMADVVNLKLHISEASVRLRSGTIRGVILGPEGQPAEGVDLIAKQGVHGTGLARSASDGTFMIDAIPEGVYEVTGRSDVGVAIASNVETGSSITLNLRVMPSITGTILDAADKPAPNCAVRLLPSKGDMRADDAVGSFFESLNDLFQASGGYTAISNENGLFAIKNVEPGAYSVEALSPLKGIGKSDLITVTEDAAPPPVTIRLVPNATGDTSPDGKERPPGN